MYNIVEKYQPIILVAEVLFVLQTDDALKVVNYIRVDVVGSEYRFYQEQAIRNELNSCNCSIVVRGERSVACGVGLAFNVVAAVAEDIAAGLISAALKGLVVKIKGAISGEGLQAACFADAVIEVADCDLIIKANCNAGVNSEYVNYDELIRSMLELSKKEKDSGRIIKAIEAPCDIDLTKEVPDVRCCGVGNFSLWRVTYRNGDRWPCWLYDAANDCFLPLAEGFKQQIQGDSEDVFYSETSA